MKALKNVVASRSQLITKSTFKGYDVCLNPYVGCQFGCKYCYVRFFVKDDEAEWGDFVRRREHIAEKLPKEIAKGFVKVTNGKIKNADGSKKQLYKTIQNKDIRMVIGTMTDPYMPIERNHRLTRTLLTEIIKAGYNKVGLFTRSPIVLDDLDLIKQLPRARVHYSITPYKKEILQKIEPIAIMTSRRFKTIRAIKEAGIRVHVNVAPAIPIYSDGFENQFCKQLAEAKVDEFFVDPMQAYDQSFTATKEALKDDKDWPTVEEMMQTKEMFLGWKEDFRKRWEKAWKKHGRKETLAIWCDHVSHTWDNLRTGEKLDPRRYND